ncbi:hypothetical protein [uncultured Actinomyces sp.]|uniref:hypothetical protein n=1 Tax=uncultured Actinomyces sp. TaxID=249061 RepID=UPI00260721F9|nr:hypothetical protein [uncultured Actinomyces sp.]
MFRRFWQRSVGVNEGNAFPCGDEAGEATVEFVAMLVIILIPVAYFIFTVAAFQAAVFASEAATRESGRLLANDPLAHTHVERQVDQIFTDYNVSGEHSLEVVCDPTPCSQAKFVSIEVQTQVALPLIPDAMARVLHPQVPVVSSVHVPVNRIELVRQ